MNQVPTSRIISACLLTFIALLVIAQFAFPQVSAGGGWCMPSFDAPTELGHPSYQFRTYGFPVQFVTLATEECFSEQSSTLEWFFPGIVIDSLLSGIILYVWVRQNRRYPVLLEEK
jgi:fucose 4-O-acetylase-like acetyltransferase